MSKKSALGLSVETVMENVPIRSISLWCLAIFNPDKPGPPRVWSFLSSQELLENFFLYKDSSLFPVTFSKQIFITPGHPLYDQGEPISVKHGVIK